MKKLLGLFIVFLLTGFSLFTFANNSVVVSEADYQQYREQSRAKFLTDLDAKLQNNYAGRLFNVLRSSISTQYFSIVGGDVKKEFYLYGVESYMGYRKFKVTNDSSSEDDINVAVYALKSDGKRGSKVAGWFDDIEPGTTKTVEIADWDYGSKDYIVVIENDGFFREKNKRVSGSISDV